MTRNVASLKNEVVAEGTMAFYFEKASGAVAGP
jgi:hypothetical protein